MTAEVGVHRADLRHARASLLRAGVGGRDFTAAYAGAVDEWLQDLFEEVVGAIGEPGVSLIAVGGYGRGELCPWSDLDLVLVHEGGRAVPGLAEALWYPIWDAGFHLDHSVRTPREVAAMAGKDLKVALGLLSARRIAGDAVLARQVVERARSDWAGKPRTSLSRLRDAVQERWRAYGDLAFLLEPDVKQCRGGLRDVEALRAAALATRVARGPLQDTGVDGAHAALLDVRVALHAVTGRPRDALAREDQAAVAARLAMADRDVLMTAVAATGRRLALAAEDTWDRVDAWMRGPGRRGGRDRALEPGIVLRDGEVGLDGRASPSIDDSLPLRVAAAAARAGIPVSRETLARIDTEKPGPTGPWAESTRHALVSLLGCGAASVRHLETLDSMGVLGAYLPEWDAVRNRQQRDAYHLYTVDRHLLETVAEAAPLVRRVHRPDLLLVAALLHDIGKGRGGDHTSIGMQLVAEISTRMGFDPTDVDALVALVRDHLLLAETATRRDLSDPATIAAVAARVATAEQLDLLAALTEADARATGPAAWSAWKAELIGELVARTRGELAGSAPPPPVELPSAAHRALMAGGRLRVVPDHDTMAMVAPDRPGLLAVVAGVLSLHRLSVRSAAAASEHGMAVDVFHLDTGRAAFPDWAHIAHDIETALEDPDLLHRRLGDRARNARRSSPLPPAGTNVVVDNDATPRATVVEVRTEDGPGVLHRLALLLAEAGLDIASAKVETLGHDVVDTFYVKVAAGGGKLTDEAAVEALRAEIVSALDLAT